MAVNNQRVISSHFPYLPLRIKVRRGTHVVEALIDTGFDGDIALPSKMIMNGNPPDGYHRWKLADQSIVVTPYYIGTVGFGKIVLPSVLITVLGNEPIIGRGIIADFKVTLDRGKQVILES